MGSKPKQHRMITRCGVCDGRDRTCIPCRKCKRDACLSCLNDDAICNVCVGSGPALKGWR